MAANPADGPIFHRYLAAKGLAARWTGEATPITSAEIRAAYPTLRFYYTFKHPPAPPGAPMPDLLEAHQRAIENYQQHSLRLTVGIDEGEHVYPFRSPEDFNVGSRPVKSDEDARTAAAAILSLMGTEQVSPGVISAQEVSATKSEAGWRCQISQKPQGVQGEVTFDLAGRCTSANKSLNYSRPIPP
ncbi:MAG: hypothetical protein M3Z64_03985 [Verrucomicrobiota bacterium]|nr:hypothetical protein [Verrucomicrobiota bacterium]